MKLLEKERVRMISGLRGGIIGIRRVGVKGL